MLIKRRSILTGLATAACTPMFLRGLAAEAASADDTIMVVIGLSGGNDGLNTVIPLQQYAAYSALRTPPQGGGATLAFSEASLQATAFNTSPSVAASHASEFAFAPTMTAMRQLYGTGKLAVLTGIGLPAAEEASLSHFNAWTDWSTGQINIDASALPYGWLGASLDNVAVGVLGPTASTNGEAQIIVGQNHPGLVVDGTWSFNIQTPNNVSQFFLGDAFQQVLNLTPNSTTAAYTRSMADATVNAVGLVQEYAQLAADYPSPQSYLAQQLMEIAQMIMGGSGIRGYVAIDGSYDTHSGQNNYGGHPTLVGNMSTSLLEFYTYLQSKRLSSNVVIATISDFGRTPAANLSIGTDHGAASVAFVLGDRVKGGVYGKYPSLTSFDVNGNLAVKMDFRNMLSDLIGGMGGNPATVLGETYPRIGFI